MGVHELAETAELIVAELVTNGEQHPARKAARRTAAKDQDEIVKINTQARHIALQIALLVPILAGLAGLGISFRMMRLPDPAQSGSAEQMALG